MKITINNLVFLDYEEYIARPDGYNEKNCFESYNSLSTPNYFYNLTNLFEPPKMKIDSQIILEKNGIDLLGKYFENTFFGFNYNTNALTATFLMQALPWTDIPVDITVEFIDLAGNYQKFTSQGYLNENTTNEYLEFNILNNQWNQIVEVPETDTIYTEFKELGWNWNYTVRDEISNCTNWDLAGLETSPNAEQTEIFDITDGTTYELKIRFSFSSTETFVSYTLECDAEDGYVFFDAYDLHGDHVPWDVLITTPEGSHSEHVVAGTNYIKYDLPPLNGGDVIASCVFMDEQKGCPTGGSKVKSYPYIPNPMVLSNE